MEIYLTIKPYVEYVKKVNQMESDKIRITFSIVLSGKLEGVKAHPNSQNNQIEVNVDKLIASLTGSIIKITTILHKPTTIPPIRPIVLDGSQFLQIERLSFNLPT
jgi:hypothetical protein